MTEIHPKSSETIKYRGQLGEVVSTQQEDGRIFERFRRSPGTRLIIISPENKILVTKEYRQEASGIDLRLPGGKVCNTLDEYKELLASGQNMTEAAAVAAKKEALEETGLIINDLELVTVANAGATVEWDLYYFIARKYETHREGQQLEVGEDIEVTWASPKEIMKAIENGDMSEWRSIGVLLGKVLPRLLNDNGSNFV